MPGPQPALEVPRAFWPPRPRDTFIGLAVLATLLPSVVASLPAHPAVVLPGPLLAFGLNEGSGFTTQDASGNGYSGTLANGSAWTIGVYGNAISFDGVNDYVDAGNSAAFNLTGDLTAEAWIFHRTNTGADVAIGKGSCYGAACPFDLRITGAGNVCFDQGNGTSGQDAVCSAPVISLNQWTHVAITRSGTTRSVYVNGLANITSSSQTKAPTSNAQALTLGTGSSAVPSDAPFDGLIDEVRIYNRALSQTEIQADMNTAIASAPPQDTTPPVISNITASTITQNAATINWTTSEPSDSQVDFPTGPCPPAGCTTPLVATLVTGHTLTLTGLSASTTYTYRVLSRDVAGNLSVSGTNTLTTSIPPPPSTTISITNGTMTASVDLRCGGALSELRLNSGPNYINNFDCGRQIQAALYDGAAAYDGCAGCTGVWGWDPVQGGDQYSHGSLVLDQISTPTSIYIRSQPYQWYPDDKGGNASTPVLSDTYLEQTITFVPGQTKALKIHYTITYFGNTTHANSFQELPAVYANSPYNRFVYYSGANPWTNGPLTTSNVLGYPPPAHPNYYSSEFWTALVDAQNAGVAVYYPGEAPYFDGLSFSGTTGVTGFAANYFRPYAFLTFEPNAVVDLDLYLAAGTTADHRTAIYAIRNANTVVDFTTPFGHVDAPGLNQTVSGTVDVWGWIMDNTAVSHVDVFVDNQLAGTATYGVPRPDVATVFPNAPTNIGFSYTLDTTTFSNGAHAIVVKAYDINNHVAIMPPISGIFDNVQAPPTVPTANFSAGPASIIAGQSSTLTWSTTNASSASIDQGIGAVALSGNHLVSPVTTTTYTLTVVGSSTITRTATVTVTPSDTTPPVISNISASGITQNAATINWTTNEASDTQAEFPTGSCPSAGCATPVASAMVTSHTVSLTGLAPSTTYTYRLLSRDGAGNLGVSGNQTLVTQAAPLTPITVFQDSFEVSEWNGLWTEDTQNDWVRSAQRAANGTRSAEADGSATDAQLISIPINLQGRTNVTISFSWYNESSLDTGEYLALDVSTDGGAVWTEKARLRANVDPENQWRAVQVSLTGIAGLRLRFRARMSDSTEDANVDQVLVTAW